MLEKIRSYDVVVGSRYVAGGELEKRWSWWRRFLSSSANEVSSRGILGLEARDITAGFKCWRRNTLLGIGLDAYTRTAMHSRVEMAYLSEKLGYRVKEFRSISRIGESASRSRRCP